MNLSERAEELLETLWVHVVQKKKIPDIEVFKNDLNFKELLDNKYISLKQKGIFTPKGEAEGLLCVRRHRLAERLLVDVLNVKPGLIHEAGCKMEHVLHKGLEDNICILLGHPETCPHGRPIPKGACCKKRSQKVESFVMPLSDLKKKQSGRVAYLHTDDRLMLRKIMAMGVLPGMKLILLQKFPSFVFKIGESQFAVDKNIADNIKIWLSRA